MHLKLHTLSISTQLATEALHLLYKLILTKTRVRLSLLLNGSLTLWFNVRKHEKRFLTDLAAYVSVEEGMNVGHQNLGQSIKYQAFRYHLISVPLLADDGPFAWAGVPSLLFTDFDVQTFHNFRSLFRCFLTRILTTIKLPTFLKILMEKLFKSLQISCLTLSWPLKALLLL
jgi:hypothetical protein